MLIKFWSSSPSIGLFCLSGGGLGANARCCRDEDEDDDCETSGDEDKVEAGVAVVDEGLILGGVKF